jgi:hypothetical protein
MRNLAIICLLAWAVCFCGCRVGRLGKSVVKNQGQTAEGILYTDTLFTDDGRSRLTGPSK